MRELGRVGSDPGAYVLLSGRIRVLVGGLVAAAYAVAVLDRARMYWSG